MIVTITHLTCCFLTSFFVAIAVCCVKRSATYLKYNVLGSKSVGLLLIPCQQDSLSGSLKRYISISIAWQYASRALTKFYAKRMFEGQLKITFLRLPVQYEFVSECPFPTIQMPFGFLCFSALLLAHWVPWVDTLHWKEGYWKIFQYPSHAVCNLMSYWLTITQSLQWIQNY